MSERRIAAKESPLGFKVYDNPDERCIYPFDDCSAGYCWSYAHHVDGNPRYSDMMKICPRCEMWLPEAQRRAVVEYAYFGWHNVLGRFIPKGEIDPDE